MMDLVIRALAGGRPVAARRRFVRRFALLPLVVTGCFYVEPINQRPSLAIRQTSSEVVYREDPVRLEAIASDPENHFVLLRWRAYLCSANEDCDQGPFVEKTGSFAPETGGDSDFQFVVPRMRNDPDEEGRPHAVEAIRVVLWGHDDYGAIARPDQVLWIPVVNRAPTLVLGKDSRYGYVVNTPINVFAEVGDPDDWPAVPELAWEVFSPTNQPGHELVDITVNQETASSKTFGKKFTPNGVGDWEIRVTATDALGEPTTKSQMITVTADAPPCLRSLSPIVAPAGNALPISEPTLFQVHVVADDLDPYPTVNDPQLGTTTFAWSIKTNTGARQELAGVTGNGVGLDPASYQPGDIVELRVEIFDRKSDERPISCADGNPTCSVISDNNCLQRQTWRVEMR
jgi:hypothetical protein